MTEQYQIVNNPLSPDQDFKYLKEEGLAFIQKSMGNQWTNLNPSDPGITILDQVCYALTELGYCNNFPVADILTGSDGKLKIKDQFYLPEEILTTSPLTIDDYRKYIIDSIEGVDNAIIIACSENIIPINRCYRVYLLIDRSITEPSINPKHCEEICKAAFYSLNKSRNLGELFLMPEALQKKPYILIGEIEIENEQEQNNVLLNIQNAICNYIFPDVEQTGYNQLIENGVGTDQIFNGPLLNNGWITNENLGSKKHQLNAFELGPVIESVPGVISASVSGFYFSGPTIDPILEKKEKIHSEQNQVLFINILQSRADQGLKVKCNDITLTYHADRILSSSLGKLPQTEQKIVYGAKVNIHAELPKGTFRDINTYYSIQNTFPEIFALGEGAIPADAAPGQIALSRQLKGYLTLFDQVLANQFSQLANISCLFSFKNSMTGTPSDLEAFNATKTKPERKYQQYPVPYKVFSPTYYYQSLYNIPEIRPLLKDSFVFNYSYGPIREKELEEKSRIAYMLDPYNAYIYGLMLLMENENVNLDRRNEMLDHLLARHGESPLVIDAITDGFTYTGNNVKDKVIFKSLYLQNLGLLSYYRQRAYYYLGADKIVDELFIRINSERIDEIIGEDSVDFIFNSGKVDRLEKLTGRDFINYSATELKLGLLFGLKYRYRNFIRDMVQQREIIEKVKKDADLVLELKIITGFERTVLDFLEGKAIDVLEKDIEKILAKVIGEELLNELLNLLEDQVEWKLRIALWFIEKRKGLILIETALLWKDLNFNLTIAQYTDDEPYWLCWLIEKDPLYNPGLEYPLPLPDTLRYEEAALVNEVLSTKDQKQLDDLTKYGGTFQAGDNYYKLKRPGKFTIPANNYQPLNSTTNYLAALTIKPDREYENETINTLLKKDLILIFPDFVYTLNTPGFNDRLDLFMQNTLPVTVNYSKIPVSAETFKKHTLIGKFENWYDSLRHHPEELKIKNEENSEPVVSEDLNLPEIIIDEKAYRTYCAYELLNDLINIYPLEK